jgi:hypothetical protein
MIEDCCALALCGRRAILISKGTKCVEASALRAEPSVHCVECLQNLLCSVQNVYRTFCVVCRMFLVRLNL